MEDKKYRILYNEKEVVDVLEDYGTTFIGHGTDLMVMVDTKENAKLMLESVNIGTERLFNETYGLERYGMLEPLSSSTDLLPTNTLSDNLYNSPSVTGIDYLDSINNSIDPANVIEGII